MVWGSNYPIYLDNFNIIRVSRALVMDLNRRFELTFL